MSGLATKELPGNDRQGDRSDDDHNNNREDVIGTHILFDLKPIETLTPSFGFAASWQCSYLG